MVCPPADRRRGEAITSTPWGKRERNEPADDTVTVPRRRLHVDRLFSPVRPVPAMILFAIFSSRTCGLGSVASEPLSFRFRSDQRQVLARR